MTQFIKDLKKCYQPNDNGVLGVLGKCGRLFSEVSTGVLCVLVHACDKHSFHAGDAALGD